MTINPTPVAGQSGHISDHTQIAASIAASTATNVAARVHNAGTTATRQLDVSLLTPLAGSTSGTLLTIPTGYTGNDIVEPSILFDATAPFLGYEYVLCAAPYYLSSAVYENPCLWVSHDGSTWVPVVNGVPTSGYGGTATPIFAAAVQGDGNNSDPALFRGPDGTYYLLWNQFLVATGSGGTGTGGNDWAAKISSASSLAGPWSTPVACLQVASGTIRPSSPSIFWDGRLWHMYAVDLTNTSSTTLLHYTNPATNPTTGTWTKLANPSASVPAAYTGQVWWHLNAYLVGTQHVLVIQDSAAGTSGGGNIWLATSNDSGTTWAVPTRPWLDASDGYRAAMVLTDDGGADVLYGRLATNWEIRRARMSFVSPVINKYGGISSQGLPYNVMAIQAAKVPMSPYVFGDTCRRSDSAVSPGTADSGQSYTVDTGTVGISSNQFYAVAASNTRARVTASGLSNGVFTCEFSVVDLTAQQHLLFRIVDTSNYLRLSQFATYQMQDIVGGSISKSMTSTLVPANGDVVAVICNGSLIVAYVNGAVVFVARWSDNAAGSGIGWQTNGVSNCRARNFTARPLVNGA